MKRQLAYAMQEFYDGGIPQDLRPRTIEYFEKALRAARDKLGIKDCTIVTWDSQCEAEDGIKVVPVLQWCLR